MKTMRNLFFVAFVSVAAMVVSCADKPGGSDKNSTSVTEASGDNVSNVAADEPGDSTSMDTDAFKNSKKKALLIGVGNYPTYPNKEEAWDRISSGNDINLLNGALNEVGFEVIRLTENKATYQGIKNALKDLTAMCQEGDTVLVHFSGHGQQMVDLEGDEPDGKAETFVPYDAKRVCSADANGYRGQCHFTDDELHTFITTLKQKLGKSGYLLVTLDACHSGGDESGETTVRGTKDIFGKGILERAKIKPRFIAGTVNNAVCVTLSACKFNESNHEITKDGKSYGSLSFAMFEKLNEIKGGKLTFDKLAQKLVDDWSNENQTPVIDKKDENMQ